MNTRITQDLDEELKKQAEEMDMPVSQLVRRILQRTVDMVGNISGNVEYLVHEVLEDVGNLADVTRQDDPTSKLKNSPALKAVVGWQPMQAQRRMRCALSGAPIEPGDACHISVKTDGSEPFVIARGTFEALTTPSAKDQWVELVVTSEVACAASGAAIEPGSVGYLLVGSQPPKIICSEEYERSVG